MIGVYRCESSAPLPSPGKCLPQPTTPCAESPPRRPRAYCTTPAGVEAETRVPMTGAEIGSARSNTGASVVLKPNAFTARPTNSPCSLVNAFLPVAVVARATACAEGIGASASRSLSTVPPSRSTQRRACGAHKSVASASSPRVWRASAMFLRKRMIPAGRTSLSQARSSPISSAPPRPTTSRLPAARRRFAVIPSPSAPAAIPPAG